VEIRLLGLVEASHDGHAVRMGGPKPRSLLAILALHANSPVSADRLIEGLWGERPPASAHKLLQVLVSQLRKQLAGADAAIVTRGRSYELRMDPDAIDALLFERLLASGSNGSQVREALSLWRGPPLDDLADEPFAAHEIRRLEDLWLRAREAATDAALAEGRHAAVLGEIDELLSAHPLRERLHAQRMLALYRCGNQAEALEAFRDARRVLLDEVGLEPGRELRGVNDAILRQDPALDGPPERAFPGRTRRRPWRLLAAAGLAVAAAVVLVATQLAGSGGLDRISEDAVGVVDPGSGHIVARYGVGHAPEALVAGGGSVWTASGRDGTISRVDRGAGQVTTIDIGGEPTALAYGAGSVWVADGQNRRVDQVNPATNRVARRWPVGNVPRGVAIASGALWLTSAVDGQVERVDLAGRRQSRRVDVAGGPAAIAAGGGAVWVAGEGDAVVTRLDPRSGAALKSIGVGNGPAAIVVGYGGVWVANRDDGTVTKIDPGTDTVTDTVRVGGRPVAVAAGSGGIWVADGDADALIRIDPKTRRVTRHVPVGSAPSAVAVTRSEVWATATASRASHHGGTLRFASPPWECNCIDPASYGGTDWSVLSLAYDGLVAYRRIAGAGGSTLVPDLATSIPQPADGGRTYTFRLREGLRFSDGAPVRPEDFRSSIERVMRLSEGLAPPFFGSIAGAEACGRRRCELPEGIETDDAARTITIHLRRPDSEFVHKLASPYAFVLPSGAPARFIRSHPQPGTGPYRVATFSRRRGARLVRNQHFRSWSAEARPDGFADAIDVSFSMHPLAQISAVQRGRADTIMIAGLSTPLVPVDVARALARSDASHVHAAPFPTTNWLFLNVRTRPFDDARVRRALSYAIDHRRVVALAGGSGLVGLTCQFIPPGLPGYAPTCPYTLGPAHSGTWSAPDLARARRLVAASGTRGVRVQLWGFTKYAAVIRYVRDVLRRLGYEDVRARVMPLDSYFAYVNDPRHRAQAGMYPWIADYLTPSSFFDPFTCSDLSLGPLVTANLSQFCDHDVDAARDAALAAPGSEANTRWAAVDRRVLAAAPAIPLFNRRTVLLVSDRVGNAQMHQELGPLLDQFWVH
jgi:peptide/nickel transport system substrate-binding protein